MVIDFSCKHDILIKNPDGTFSRMDEPYFRAEKIAPDTWMVLSSGDYAYLLAGDKEAAAIDTGYGAGNIRQFMQTLTDKPVRNVFNTHSHFDHTANNAYFEKAYMAKKAVPLATEPYASFRSINFPKDYIHVGIAEGFQYDLGGRILEVFDIPDHTDDGIALLDRRNRLLIAGDEFMPLPMGKRLRRVTVKTFSGYLDKLMAHRSEFDRLLCGSGVQDAALLDDYNACAKAILSGAAGQPWQPPKHGGPAPMAPGPNGETVYDRIRPHAGDGGAGKPEPPGNYFCLRIGCAQIIYDRDMQPSAT
jgi:glyoxylase-like metal-dependent hydrolase (beta-lactamase superfamily II)